jgi:hypothetical protein
VTKSHEYYRIHNCIAVLMCMHKLVSTISLTSERQAITVCASVCVAAAFRKSTPQLVDFSLGMTCDV